MWPLRFSTREWLLCAVAICGWLGLHNGAAGLTPESPEVKAAVAKGIKYLKERAAADERTGAQALAAMAIVKVDGNLDHPVVKAAVARIRKELKAKEGEFNHAEEIYHIGLSLVFLASADGVAYRPEIDALLNKLMEKQKKHGGWGYPQNMTGDTSMTQYGVLGLWESYRIGANSPLASWERVCNWLLRTQDPGGGFGYQGEDPGSFTPVAQTEIRPSMAAAGLGSLYVCGEHFGLAEERSENDRSVSSALKEKKKEGGRERRKPAGVDLARLRAGMQRGNGWFGKNFSTKPNEWAHYYYYAYERYQSFREAVEKINDKEPAWYTQIATELMKTQSADGNWTGLGGEVPDTAFGVLFLIRSTKKSIQQALGAGTLVGGRGLPTDASNVEMRLGSVVRKPLSGPADQLLSVMEDPSNPEFLAAVEGLAEAKLEADDAQLNQNLVKLKKLAGGNSPEARAVAVRLLGRSRSLDNVPVLIFAMRDPDLRVVKEARDGLRFISRKFDAFGPEIPEGTYEVDQFEKERRAAIEAWKAWYLSVRPDHAFED